MGQPLALTLTGQTNTPFVQRFSLVGVNDLSGYGAKLQIRGAAGAVPGLVSCELVTGTDITGITVSGTNFVVFIGQEDLELIGNDGAQRKLAYDLLITRPDGSRYCYASGSFILNPGVTQ